VSATIHSYLENKTIGLLGFGMEGRSSYAFLRRYFPEKHLLIADRSPLFLEDGNVTRLDGDDYLTVMSCCDLLIKSPGVSLRGVAIPAGLEVTCQTDLFLRFAGCVAVGVTGSKGKTTTSTLIYEMLRASGIPARLIGNVGVPVLDSFDEAREAIAVIELSSHQLQFTHASPHVAVWTNLYEEHLDHYDGGFTGYAAAKAHICRSQAPGDIFIYNKDQPPERFTNLDGCRARRVPVGLDAGEEDPFLASLDGVNDHLRGEHNRQNVYFAATAARMLGATKEGVRDAVARFRGIPHRMEMLGEYGGIRWVDNSISTIPRAVLCDIDALKEVDTLIFGGKDRGLDYREFAAELVRRPVRNLIGMPETGYAILELLRERGSAQNLLPAETMEEAVAAASVHTKPGGICLLAPAAASYNRYRNFEEKGDHFAALARGCVDQ
jgi:UDP-N-acetylmuramoylalanine--D-glutamate ligase